MGSINMVFKTRQELEEGVERLRTLEDGLAKLGKIKYSILGEISFRLSLSMATWYHGIVQGLPDKTMKKLPKELGNVLEFYYQLSGEVKRFYLGTKSDGDASIKVYLGIRKRMLLVIRNIRRGLLGSAVKEMQFVVSILKSNIHTEGQYPKDNFKNFWSKYTQGEAYFSEIFLPSFPNYYDPRVEPEYSAALEKTINLEESALDSAITGEHILAIGNIEEWFSFMKNFINKREYSQVTPKRII